MAQELITSAINQGTCVLPREGIIERDEIYTNTPSLVNDARSQLRVNFFHIASEVLQNPLLVGSEKDREAYKLAMELSYITEQ